MKLTGTIILAKSKNERNLDNVYWNGKTYSSKHEGGVRIYLNNEEYHVTKESLDALLAQDEEKAKEAKTKEFEKAMDTLANIIGECEEKEAHRKLALLLSKINIRNSVNEKTSSNCDFTQMLNKMSEKATLTYNR